VVPQLGTSFDAYWNSERAYPLSAVSRDRLDPQERRQVLDRMISAFPEFEPAQQADALGRPPVSADLASGRPDWIHATVSLIADSPDKGRHEPGDGAHETVAQRFQRRLMEAHNEAVIVSPYFIPGTDVLAQLLALRGRAVTVSVITNSADSTDEPLANLGYERYRDELLNAGIRLYEVGPALFNRDRELRETYASSRGRLHAKFAIVDRELVMVGSANVDPRSSRLNTEIGVGVRSARLAGELSRYWHFDSPRGAYQLRLNPDSSKVQWLSMRDDGSSAPETAPAANWFNRLRLQLLSLFISDDLL